MLPRDARARAGLAAAVLLGLALWRQSGSSSEPIHADLDQAAASFAYSRPGQAWEGMQRTLASEVAAADAGQGLEVVFLGDSLTEAFRGTQMGSECCEGVPTVFAKHIGSKYRAAALGIAGDQAGHLMWRLLHGELPKKPPKLVVVLMGTNDLGLAAAEGGDEPAVLAAVQNTTARVETIVEYLLEKLPGTQVALLALMPRGGGRHRAANTTPYSQPNIFSSAIEKVNAQFKEMAAGTKRVHYVDCHGPLLLAEDGSVNEQLMPDALHPVAAGYELLFSKCWDQAVASLVG